MKKYVIGLVLIIVMIATTGCLDKSTEQQIAEQQNLLVTEASNQIGMPNVKEFYEKKMTKEIIELRDNSKLICYAYTQNMNGKFVYLGKCMGFGLPYSVQYTNPEALQRFEHSGGYDYQIVPQADPNGLYMPNGLSATWLMMVNEETGKREVMYVEPNTVVTQTKLNKRLCEPWSLPVNY